MNNPRRIVRIRRTDEEKGIKMQETKAVRKKKNYEACGVKKLED